MSRDVLQPWWVFGCSDSAATAVRSHATPARMPTTSRPSHAERATTTLPSQSVFRIAPGNTAVYDVYSRARGHRSAEPSESGLHGAAFAYRARTRCWVTNEHAATLLIPVHLVDRELPAGCKLVSQTLALVDNGKDHQIRDDVAATVVVSDSGWTSPSCARMRCCRSCRHGRLAKRRPAGTERGRFGDFLWGHSERPTLGSHSTGPSRL